MNPALQSGLLAVVGVLLVVSLAWVAHDAGRRGRNPAVWMVLCLLTWPLGLMFWRLVRPPPHLRLA